eukprot:UC1_evm1s1657
MSTSLRQCLDLACTKSASAKAGGSATAVRTAAAASTGVTALGERTRTSGGNDSKPKPSEQQVDSGASARFAAATPGDLRARGFVESTPGRWHQRHFSEQDMRALSALESRWRPLVDAHMGAGGQRPIERTDLQLLVSLPGSAHQFWHQDNRARAITVAIPLVSCADPAMGPTQLLVG